MATPNKFRYGLLALFISAALTGCGLDGEDGAQGDAGASGPQGEPGDPGADGENGADGEDASLGVTLSIVGRAFVGNANGAEIVQYHAATNTIYATNGTRNTIAAFAAADITDEVMEDPINQINLSRTNITLPEDVDGVALGSVTSIAVNGDMMAVAVPAAEKTDAGFVLFYNGLNDSAPAYVDAVQVGSLPDMVTFTPDGFRVLVANEGEPKGDYSVDPAGQVSVIDILANGSPSQSVTSVDFTAFDDQAAELEADGFLFPNPDGQTINGQAVSVSVSQDLEPEYITTTNDFAYITLQENNGLAILNLDDLSVQLLPLGFKDWSGKNIDVQEDGSVSFGQYEGLYGAYQPDTIDHYSWKGATFLVTANEGDAREYFFDLDVTIDPEDPDPEATLQAACVEAGGMEYDADNGCLAYTDEVKLSELTAVPGSALEALQARGDADDLRVTTAKGDADNDGQYEAAYSFGGRSFTIWDQNGLAIYDSGDDFERITASVHGAQFNNGDDTNEGDSRSENKGPEPEALTIGTVGNRTYAFIGLERMGGIFVYDITNPYDVKFADYVINRNLTEGLNVTDIIGDLAPESLVFVPASESPSEQALLISGNEISGTVTVWQIMPN